MSSTTEKGHPINVANLEDLISICTGFGASYNPSKAAIQIAGLTTLQTNANASMSVVTTTKIAFDNASNVRQEAFKPLKKRCTKILNALDATEASAQLVADAKSINNKIQGKRSGAKPAPPVEGATEATEDKTISVSQQSVDSLIENYKKLIELVSTEPSYTPNETELQVATLIAHAAQLKATNTTVINTNTTYSTALINRNATLYGADSGLVDIAGDVKKYVKSVYGASSPQYKQVSAIKFTKLKK